MRRGLGTAETHEINEKEKQKREKCKGANTDDTDVEDRVRNFLSNPVYPEKSR